LDPLTQKQNNQKKLPPEKTNKQTKLKRSWLPDPGELKNKNKISSRNFPLLQTTAFRND
jgi:hypothetical protein